MAHINLFALGGQDENGKNCYVLEHQADIFIINVGVKIQSILQMELMRLFLTLNI